VKVGGESEGFIGGNFVAGVKICSRHVFCLFISRLNRQMVTDGDVALVGCVVEMDSVVCGWGNGLVFSSLSLAPLLSSLVLSLSICGYLILLSRFYWLVGGMLGFRQRFGSNFG